MNHKSLYPANWNDTIRPAILKRDKYKCTICSIHHRQIVYVNENNKYIEADQFVQAWAKAKGYRVFAIYLQVAHLDQDRSNNSESNLASMCPKCHLKHDRFFNNLKRKAKHNLNKAAK